MKRKIDSKIQICIIGLIIRLIVLGAVLIFKGNLSEGFYSDDIHGDDVRYIAGALDYANEATSLIDKDTYVSVYAYYGDWNGYDDVIQIWYWFVCFGVYIFHNVTILRFINILFSVFCIKHIYELAEHFYGVKVARTSSTLYAIAPYPVFFSCFLYKDQLYTLVTLYLIKKVIFYGKYLKWSDWGKIVICILLSAALRSGFVIIIMMILIFFYYRVNGYKLSNIKTYMIAIPVLILFCAALFYSWDKIILKLDAYITSYDSGEGVFIQFFNIKSLVDIYKFPFSLCFLMLQPLAFHMAITTWSELVGLLNIVCIPIAIGNFIYLCNINIRKNYFYWGIMGLYLIVIMTSLGITRHSYFLQPFMMMFFADLIMKIKFKP